MTELPDAPKKTEVRRTFTEEPKGVDLKAIRQKRLEPTYQCCRCNRKHDMTPLVLFAGKYYCEEHYRDRRVEMSYEEKPFPDEWREQMISLMVAKHPEWKRQAGESRTEYTDRMLDECAKINPGIAAMLRVNRARPERNHPHPDARSD